MVSSAWALASPIAAAWASAPLDPFGREPIGVRSLGQYARRAGLSLQRDQGVGRGLRHLLLFGGQTERGDPEAVQHVMLTGEQAGVAADRRVIRRRGGLRGV